MAPKLEVVRSTVAPQPGKADGQFTDPEMEALAPVAGLLPRPSPRRTNHDRG